MPLTIPPRSERPYELLVWGATGFTGQLVAQFIAGTTGRSALVDGDGSGAKKKLRWALGGRSETKLNKVKLQLMQRLNSALVEEPAIILADSDDQQSLQRLTAQTRVVISTVGPFSLYGEPLVASCCKTGTDYVDITGESPWVAQMIERYAEHAARSGAVLVSMSGFDSVPADLCSFLAADWLRQEKQLQTGEMKGYCSVKGGGVSGGTIASVLYMQEQRAQGKLGDVSGAYLLNPRDFQYGRKRASEREHLLPGYDRDTRVWYTPFVMALVNTRLVRRSLALRRQFERERDGFGPEASYNEVMVVPSPIHALVVWIGLALMALVLHFSLTRAILKKFVPASGEGPSEQQRAQTTFDYRVRARGWHPDEGGVAGAEARNVVVEARMQGGDPGYTDTAKMVSCMGLLLAREREALPLEKLMRGRTAAQGPIIGGFFTPSFVAGHRLADCLREAGIKIDVKPVSLPNAPVAAAAAAGSSSKND